MVLLDVDVGEGSSDPSGVVQELQAAVAAFQVVDLDRLDPESELALVRQLEVVRRRLDHATDRVAGHLDRSQAYAVDGLAHARAALVHLGRLPGPEARARVATATLLAEMPLMAAAYAAGEIPTTHVRAVERLAGNRRVRHLLPDADAEITARARRGTAAAFTRWIRGWERLHDQDGVEQDAATSHARRRGGVVENFDGGFSLHGGFGNLQGAVIAEVLERFAHAELMADWADARARLGDAATAADLARTPAQRGADALVAIFTRASGPSGTAQPLVDIIVDLETFERALVTTRDETSGEPQGRLTRGPQVCQTVSGIPLAPSDVVAAATVGRVRRVVIDPRCVVVDMGSTQRLFTGGAKDAAEITHALRHPEGLGCIWNGCERRRGLETDHDQPFSRGGRTDQANAAILCDTHNRLKNHGWHPARGPDGTWTLHRPDGTPTTQPA